MKKIYVFLIFIILSGGLVRAQQDPQFSHNMFNLMGVNPGYAGANGEICLTALYRQQWVGFPGAPQTGQFTIEAPVYILRGGLGANILTDKLGPESNLGFNFNYAYRRALGAGNIGIGARVGFLNKGMDFSTFKPSEPEAFLGGNIKSDMFVDYGAGVYYEIPNKVYAGFSVSQISGAKGIEDLGVDLTQHYYFTAGYTYQFNNPDYEIKPAIFIKSDKASTQFDINALLLYRRFLWGGFTFRTGDAAVFLLGIYPFYNSATKGLRPIRVGYSYDLTTSEIGKEGRSSGSHEIMLGYCFKIEIPRIPSKYKNPRFL